MSQGKDAAVVDQFIDRLNVTLEDFIRHALENNDDGDLDYSKFFPPMGGRKRCWEVKDCHYPGCPARTSDDYRCWLVAGTLCGGVPRGEFAQKYDSCFACSFYRSSAETPAGALFENITTIIKHFIDRTRLLREMATRDTLTGLYNRHFLNMIAAREEAVADRSGNPLSMILIDINGFKAVNDTWGHMAGDRALCDFAGFLREQTRESDYLFRLGGDEFMLLMNGADENACRAFGQRLLTMVAPWNESRKAQGLVTISFSLGGATAGSYFSLDKLLHEADGNLYRCKEQEHANRLASVEFSNACMQC
jgi:diguanylate cyclase (GGDEF)-like protein